MSSTWIAADESYLKYKNFIPAWTVFKKIASDEVRKALLMRWESRFGGKVMRDKLGITYQGYYAHITKLKDIQINMNELDEYESVFPDHPINIMQDDAPEEPPTVPVNKKMIIDAEYTTVESNVEEFERQVIKKLHEDADRIEKYKAVQKAELEAAAAALETPVKPFFELSVTDDSHDIAGRLEAIAALLRFEKTQVTVKIEVYK